MIWESSSGFHLKLYYNRNSDYEAGLFTFQRWPTPKITEKIRSNNRQFGSRSDSSYSLVFQIKNCTESRITFPESDDKTLGIENFPCS